MGCPPQASVSTDTLALKSQDSYWTTPPHISKNHEQIELLYTNPQEDLPPRHAPQRNPDEKYISEDARVDDPRYQSSQHSE